MDFEENMMEMVKLMKMLSVMAKLSGGTNSKAEESKKEREKGDMTAAERLAALEEKYAKQEEESELMKRIEALEKKAPKVNSNVPEPAGIDDIIKGLVPGLLKPDKEDE